MNSESVETEGSFQMNTDVQLDHLIELLRSDDSIASLMPEGDPKIDIKRLSKIFKDKASFVSGIQRGLESRDKKSDGSYRSAKNLVLVIAYVKMSDDSKRALRKWVTANSDKKPEDRTAANMGGLSQKSCLNYLGYLDTDRFNMNYNYLVNFFSSIFKKELGNLQQSRIEAFDYAPEYKPSFSRTPAVAPPVQSTPVPATPAPTVAETTKPKVPTPPAEPKRDKRAPTPPVPVTEDKGTEVSPS